MIHQFGDSHAVGQRPGGNSRHKLKFIGPMAEQSHLARIVLHPHANTIGGADFEIVTGNLNRIGERRDRSAFPDRIDFVVARLR